MNESKQHGKKAAGQWLLYPILLLVSAVGLVVFSWYSSPLFPDLAGYDAAFFRLVGQGMKNGMLPYRDFFDMKGPYLFFVQYICQLLIYGRFGIFIIEVLNMFGTLVCAAKIFDLCVKRFGLMLKVLCLAPVAVIFLATLEGGNSNEEWSILPLMFCTYLVIKYFKRSEETGDNRHPFAYAFCYGAVFCYLVFLRINNTAFLLAILLVITVNLIAHRLFLDLLKNIGAFLAGCLAVFIPVLVFYGANNALGEMFYAMFCLGFKYSGESTIAGHFISYFRWFCLTVASFTPVLTVIFRPRGTDWKYVMLSVTGVLAVNAALFVGNGYRHYYMLVLPLWVYAEYMVLRLITTGTALKTSRRNLIAILASIALLPYLLLLAISVYPKTKIEKLQRCRDCSIDICAGTDAKNEELFAYSVSSRFYIYNDNFPYYKYCDWQKHYIRLIPSIEDELIDMLENDPPKWIVLNAERTEDDEFEAEVKERFRFVKSNDMFELYQAK